MPFKTTEEKRAYDRQRYANMSAGKKAELIEKRRVYYEDNKPKILARTRKWTLKRLAGHKELVRVAKEVPCMDCKGTFPGCAMDFDHVKGEKGADVSRLMRNWNVSTKVLQAEMDKCDVVCANCHRIRTYRRSQDG